jgi:hypothetical protein
MLRRETILAVAVLLAASTELMAQAMAPGPALPGNLGGIGPGGTRVAPGPAVDDNLIQQEGPGGVPLATGPAISAQPTLRWPRRAHHGSRAVRVGPSHHYR